MSSRLGEVWEMGNGMLFLVVGHPETARSVLEAHGDKTLPKRSRVLDRMLWHPILWLELGSTGGLSEDRAGAWDRTRNWRRHA